MIAPPIFLPARVPPVTPLPIMKQSRPTRPALPTAATYHAGRSTGGSQVSRILLAANAAFVGLFLTACGGANSAELPTAHRLSASAIVCRVDPQALGRVIPRTLFGTNLEWFNNGNGIIANDGTIQPDWIRLAREQGVDNVRFPGGTLSDFYFWRDGVGPLSQRPVREHPTDNGSSANIMGTPEFLRFTAAVGARPLITVNVGTSNAADAAAWVAYCNQPNHAGRAADGMTAPANVKLWEVGNELYLPGNPTDKKIITMTPTQYTAKFLEYATAMRAVDPTIKLIGIGMANSTRVTLPYVDEWSEHLLKAAAPEMDYLAVHNAYFPYLFGQSGFTVKDVYQGLWASPEAVKRSLVKLDALITKHEKQRRIDIAITEWGALFSFEKDWVDHVKTVGSAVYLSRVMQVFLEQPRVTLANYFKFADRSFMGWVGYDQKPKVPYYVVQLYAKHFGDRLVGVSVDSPTYDIPAVAVMTPETKVAEVTAVASLGDNGRKLYVNLVNRSWNTIHKIRVDTGTFPAAATATVWSISSPGVLDHNGRDLPPEVPAALYNEPTLHRQAKPTIGIEQRSHDLNSNLLLPPYSILTLEIDTRS